MYSQWSFTLLLSCTIANAAEFHLPVAAMITGNLVARQELICPTTGAYTWCPGHEGCCSVGETCFTSAGTVGCHSSGPCYGQICGGQWCCSIGYECPPPGGQACIQTDFGSFPTSIPPLSFSIPTESSFYPGDFTYTPWSEPPPVTPGPTASWGGYPSPTPQPEPSSVPPASAGPSQSEGPGQGSFAGGASMAVPLLVGYAPWLIWAFPCGTGLAFAA